LASLREQSDAKRADQIRTAAAAALVSLSAQAADMPIKARPAPQAWSGCYLGYALGYAWARDFDTETVSATGLLSPFSPTDSANANGVKTGGYLGCNWQLTSSFVVGAEGDLEWADLRGSVSFPNSGPPVLRISTTSRRLAAASGTSSTTGCSFTRPSAFRGRISPSAMSSPRPVNLPIIRGPDMGLRRVRGWDYAITDRWIGRLEYRYANFGDYGYNTVSYLDFTERHKTHEIAFRWGLSYKFW
jgi:outer membrane immunogenic protein